MSPRSAPSRRTVARHAHLGESGWRRRALRVVGIGTACVAVAALATAGYALYDLSSAFRQNAVALEGQGSAPPDVAALVDDEGVDLLLTGIDVCEWDSHEKFGDRCPPSRSAYGEDGRELRNGLNDVNLLVRISPEPRRITAIAFPRDLKIPTPECTNPQTGAYTYPSDEQMLNAMYSAGGLACVAKTIDTLTTPYDPDLRIDYAATVTWNGVIEITDAVGGVEVCVAETIDDVEAGMLHLEGGQTHELVGEQALAFLRSRKGVGDGSDLARISNQQVYMSALARKLMGAEVLSNPSTLLSLARTVLTNVDPSTSLTDPMTLVRIALAAKDVPLSDIVFLQYPTYYDPTDPAHVLPDVPAAEEMLRTLAANESFAPAPSDFAPPTPTPALPSPGTTPGPTPSSQASEPPGTQIAAQGRTALDDSCAAGKR
ncbi:LCP family protein [Microbacterium sp. NPDC096154]|uniref:LCP family protein n=1 Tax=Microbacterium sp. NPDC096154 TaxID=3155549 RepID=UPI00331A5115